MAGDCVSGYIVFSGPRRANGIQGLRFIIQSEKPPHYLESRVEAFLVTMEKSIEDMAEEAFQKHIQALAIRRLDKPKKLSAECAKYWGKSSPSNTTLTEVRPYWGPNMQSWKWDTWGHWCHTTEWCLFWRWCSSRVWEVGGGRALLKNCYLT